MTDPMEETIHAAVRSGDVQKVRKVLRRNPSGVNELDAYFNSPLHLIYDYVYPYENRQADNRLEIIQLLIDYDADVNIKDRYDMTPLYRAIEKHQINGIRMLLRNKADPNIRQSFNRTALMEAIREGFKYKRDGLIVEILLKFGADPNLTDIFGNTSLDLAIELYKWDYVQILLQSGARVKNIYRTFFKELRTINLFETPKEEYFILFDLLWSHTDQIFARGQFSILNLGIHYKESLENQNERIRAFLETLDRQGIDVSYSTYSSDSDLHVAVREGNVLLVKTLLEIKKTNVNAKNAHFDTPLHFMIEMRNDTAYEEIGRLLLDAGADWRVPNVIDETPFYLAVKHLQHQLVKLILGKIARVNSMTLECNITNLPYLEIHYTENDVALHELLVAISVNCEPVIDRLLDEFYDITDASKCCRQDITIALVKAVELGHCNIVKKLLEAGFKSDSRFPGNLSNLQHIRGNKIKLSCLLWEFKDETTLVRLFYYNLQDYCPISDQDALIYLLLFYFAIDELVNGSVPELMKLQATFEWKNFLSARFAECKNDLYQMKNMKFNGLSTFDVMTMNLDFFVKFFDNKNSRNVCLEVVQKIQNSQELKYYDIALQFRLKLILEKNMVINAAFRRFYEISKNCSTKNSVISVINKIISWDTLFNSNLRDLKKLE